MMRQMSGAVEGGHGRPTGQMLARQARLLACAGLATALAVGAFGWTAAPASSAQQTAVAVVRDTSGAVIGRATFSQAPDGVQVSGSFRGLRPGELGVRIHAAGMCEGPGFVAAGGRAGDLPNLTVKPNGTGAMSVVAKGLNMGAGPASLFDADGSALVIHARPDDGRPGGGIFGDGVACGVIEGGAPAQTPAAPPRTSNGPSLTELLAGIGGLLACVAFAARRGALHRLTTDRA